MQIKSVSFEAFKSLYEMRAEFDDLTVITGPNGSGKSNLVDGLVFIANTYRHGLEFAVSHGGGYENIAHRRTRRARRPIRVSIEASLTNSEVVEDLLRVGRGTGRMNTAERRRARTELSAAVPDYVIVKHDFSFRASSQRLSADFSVIYETISLTDKLGKPFAEAVRTGPEVTVALNHSHSLVLDEFLEEAFSVYARSPFLDEARMTSSELIFGRRIFFRDIFFRIATHLSSIRVFQLSPHTSRLSGVASPRAELESHGENLPGAADYLRKNHADAWDQVTTAMRSIMPTLEEVAIAYTEDRRLAVQFREKGVGRPWNTSEMSDGTIQTFALLVAIFDPRASILVIEELENALHPWILRQLLDLCRESARQILLTTHSPVLLNYSSPSAIKLMWMVDGQSAIAPITELDQDVWEQVALGNLTVFQVYDSGLLAQGIPRGYRGDE